MSPYCPYFNCRQIIVLLSLIFCCQLSYSSTDQQTIIHSHAIAMHGEAKYPSGFSRFDYSSSLAVKGGELRLGQQGGYDSLNPFIAKGNSAAYLGLIYDTLTVSSKDEAFTQYGLLAESMEYPEDRSWIIFNLHPHATFHDGVAVTADDVVFTFNTLMEKGNPFYQSLYGDVESVVALSNKRVRFNFKNKLNQELALIVGQLAILPKHYWQDKDFASSSLEPPLGSGPYKLDSIDPGRSISYQRVSDYWGKDLAVNAGHYNFDRIIIDYYKDGNVLLEGLKAKQYDFRVEYSSKQWATGYTGEALTKRELIQEEIPHQLPKGMQAFLMNLRKPLFQDMRVRQALGLAFNFEWSNKNLFYNAYTRSQSYFSNSELAATGLPSAAELAILTPYKDQLPSSVFNQPYKAPVSDGDKYNRKNLIRAMHLLKEAGWRVVDNQLVDSNNQPFSFEITLVQPSFERIVNPYIKALKKLGITAHIRHSEVSQYINRLRNFDYDMIVGGFGQSLSPGNEQKEYWHSSTADTPASRNLIGIKNPVIDDLVDLVINAPDRASLVTRTRALDRVLLHNHYVIPQYYIASHRIAYWNKFQRPAISAKYDYGYQNSILTWWLKPEYLKGQR
ncbi:extracellular solute-binding protein [Dasania sp. GY-MA-18]|uniref:Extracellular solute-binding protein n=1 Tax=Dasania phycosphaerae TaxID=2950436 RepID=A0A9J6RJ32_9GAMM|nr:MULTISPECIES: extracellular solute-binding protein [Dasania]MCR8921779.1 extracellular solute-binding protein [Dasania sp. GY-MA-18]MCZ0864207.1 extracellular solute-binding protein [Dasania phycosphaerae]MCZ0867935.1 extracellular solute-binding protein [Dasania phycosphaerae]